eukprot:scaffold534511_cov31-Prasinocladus_malaysianus.AAC.1
MDSSSLNLLPAIPWTLVGLHESHPTGVAECLGALRSSTPKWCACSTTVDTNVRRSTTGFGHRHT